MTPPIKLLLIEDDIYDKKVVRLMLTSSQEIMTDEAAFELQSVSTLAEGIAQLSVSPLDLVLLDLNLPDSAGAGLESFTRLHANFPQLPIIVFSATDDMKLAIEAVQLGAQDYLLKGEISRNLLIRAIHHALDRQAIWRALAFSEARLQTIAEKSFDGLVVLDAAYEIRFVNPAAAKLLQKPAEALTGELFPHPVTVGETQELLFNFAEDTADITVELQAVDIVWDEKPAYLVSLRDITTRKNIEMALKRAKDDLETVVKARTSELKKANEYLLDQISERRRAQRALNRALAEAEQSREQIDTIFASVADGLLVTDENNKITMLNHAAEEILGIRLSQVLAQPIDTILYNPTLIERITQTLLSGQETQFEFEMPYVADSLSGETTPPAKVLRAKSAVVADRTQSARGVITAIYDVTREREVDRLKAEFISTAAHELRTPLTTVQGFSEILLARDDLAPEARKKYLSYINNQAMALARIVDDLLNLAKMESGREFVLNKEPIGIGAFVQNVVDKIRVKATLHTFAVNLNDDALEWVVDRPKMTQVLENLLGNAMKFAPDGGIIEVMGQSYADPQSGQRFYFLSVKDEGIGMTLAQVSHIFDRFYRGDASNTALGGTGLGMAIVKHIIEAHGGRVWVDSTPGQGTKVSFTVLLE